MLVGQGLEPKEVEVWMVDKQLKKATNEIRLEERHNERDDPVGLVGVKEGGKRKERQRLE